MPQQLALRARIVLQAAVGGSKQDIATALGTTPHTVGLWRGLFARVGMAGLHDAPRPGRPRMIDDDVVHRVLANVGAAAGR